MTRFYRRHRYQFNAAIVSLVAAIILFGILYIMTRRHPYILWIISTSLVTFALFGFDKALSKTEKARIPESVLHLLTLLGGFPGQIIGRIVFKHKTNFKRHPSFTIVLVASIALQVAIVIFVF